MRRVLPVVGLVLLAGCTGLVQDAEPTVTPAPIPEETATVALPRTNGTVDIGAVIEDHDTALAERSFHLRIERDWSRITQDVWVDRDTGVVRVRYRTASEIRDVVVTEETTYRYRPDRGRTRNYTTRPTDGDVPYVLSLSGDVALKQFLARHEYVLVGTTRWNDRAMSVLRFNASHVPVPENKNVAVDSRVYVDRRGIIRHVDHRERFDDGSGRTLRMTVTTDIGRVPRPHWLDDETVYD